MSEQQAEYITDYERKHFNIEIEANIFVGGATLSVTHNGRQFTSVMLGNREEIQKVIDALTKYLAEAES